MVNLNAMAGAAGLTYNVNSTIMLANNTTFQGDGTANFIFSGIILGNGSLIKNGSSMPTLTGTANRSGGIVPLPAVCKSATARPTTARSSGT